MMMLFKTWGYVTITQPFQFTSDLEIGHYMKIPRRLTFWCQIRRDGHCHAARSSGLDVL
jgi:hypothetical protein